MSPKLFAFTGLALLLTTLVMAQDFTIPAVPETKEQFIQSEPDIIAAAKWLEGNPIGKQKEKTIEVNAYVIQWLTKSPTVSLEISSDFIVKLFENNTQLMMVFMAGYTRYSLENNYSKDKLKGYIAGIKSAITCYALGGDTKKNKLFSKAIEADKDGNLGEWVAEKGK